MSGKPFDARMKDLLETDVVAWANLFCGENIRNVTIVDGDLATVTAASDKVMRLETDPGAYLWNLEIQSSYDGDLVERMVFYASLIRRRHKLPVRTTALLLRREANASNLSGCFEALVPGEKGCYLTFRYEVFRVWEMSEEQLLGGSFATLPLVALTDEASPHLPAVIAEVDRRLNREANRDLADRIRFATLILMGLRYEPGLVQHLFERFESMEDSRTYQAILEKGAARGERSLLLRLGSKRFGPPSEKIRTKLEAIQDPMVLESLAERLLIVDRWEDLLSHRE